MPYDNSGGKKVRKNVCSESVLQAERWRKSNDNQTLNESVGWLVVWHGQKERENFRLSSLQLGHKILNGELLLIKLSPGQLYAETCAVLIDNTAAKSAQSRIFAVLVILAKVIAQLVGRISWAVMVGGVCRSYRCGSWKSESKVQLIFLTKLKHFSNTIGRPKIVLNSESTQVNCMLDWRLYSDAPSLPKTNIVSPLLKSLSKRLWKSTDVLRWRSGTGFCWVSRKCELHR